MTALALDLGGTKLAVALFSAGGEKIYAAAHPLAGTTGSGVGMLIADIVRHVRQHYTVDAIGMAVPGIYDASTGCVWAPNIPGWEKYPLRQELQQVAGDIPVVIDSDRTCYITGECWQGHARNARNAIFIAVGTGIGAGILVNGGLLTGEQGIAGALGWMVVDAQGIAPAEGNGSFESQASGKGIPQLALSILKQNSAYAGPLRKAFPQTLTAQEILDAYEQQDPVAIQTIDRCIQLWGMVTANLVSLFNPEIIVFGGGVFGPAVKFIPAIIRETGKWAQPKSVESVRILSSRLGPEAGLYGAGKIALNVIRE